MGRRKTIEQLEGEIAVRKARLKVSEAREAYSKARDAHSKKWQK